MLVWVEAPDPGADNVSLAEALFAGASERADAVSKVTRRDVCLPTESGQQQLVLRIRRAGGGEDRDYGAPHAGLDFCGELREQSTTVQSRIERKLKCVSDNTSAGTRRALNALLQVRSRNFRTGH